MDWRSLTILQYHDLYLLVKQSQTSRRSSRVISRATAGGPPALFTLFNWGDGRSESQPHRSHAGRSRRFRLAERFATMLRGGAGTCVRAKLGRPHELTDGAQRREPAARSSLRAKAPGKRKSALPLKALLPRYGVDVSSELGMQTQAPLGSCPHCPSTQVGVGVGPAGRGCGRHGRVSSAGRACLSAGRWLQMAPRRWRRRNRRCWRAPAQ